MRTVTTTLYTFQELDLEAQKVAIEENTYINVEFDDWWSHTYEEMEDIGLICRGFDTNYYHCELEFEDLPENVALAMMVRFPVMEEVSRKFLREYEVAVFLRELFGAMYNNEEEDYGSDYINIEHIWDSYS